VENELVDLIDELLERDDGTVNSTIIGEIRRLLLKYSSSSSGRRIIVLILVGE